MINPDNYCTREAAQRLVDAGIVVETDVAWVKPALTEEWFICSREDQSSLFPFNRFLPALSYTEAWRMLPGWIYAGVPDAASGQKAQYNLEMTKCGDITWIEYFALSPSFENINPTDACIYLKIWLKGKEKET
jgi:hypothetical protein